MIRDGNTMRGFFFFFFTRGLVFFFLQKDRVLEVFYQNSESPRRDGTLCQTPFGDAASSSLPPTLPSVIKNPTNSWLSSGLWNLWKELYVGGPRKFRRGSCWSEPGTGVTVNCVHIPVYVNASLPRGI